MFFLPESLDFMFEIAHLHEDALHEYDELEICYLETGKKALTQIVQDDSFREFEFRQHLFACQAKVWKIEELFLFRFCCSLFNSFAQSMYNLFLGHHLNDFE